MSNSYVTNNDTKHLDVSIKWPEPMPFAYRARGIILFIVLLVTSMLGIVPAHFLPLCLIRPFSESLWQRYASWSCSSWFQLFMVIQERILGIKIILTGNDIKHDDWALLISNHPSEADWLYFWSVVHRRHSTGLYRAILKDMLGYAFGVGWAIWNLNFLLLSRNWKNDKAQMIYTLKQYLEFDKFLILLFPEGTDFTPAKHERARIFAQNNQLPVYKHLLLPRLKGFKVTVDTTRPKLKSVYDITVAYENGVKPTLWTAWSGWFPRRIHYHVRSFNSNEIPTEEKAMDQWLYDRFAEKDQLLDYFEKHQHFPRNEKETDGLSDKVVYGSKSSSRKSVQLEPLTAGPYLCAIGWFLSMIAIIYGMIHSNIILGVVLYSWVYFTASSFSRRMRIWRKLTPSDSYRDSIKDD